MIPILFKLRESIRFEDQNAFSLVISEAPLNAVRASNRASRVLRLCDGERTIGQIARETGIADEERVYRICDYFNKKAVLDTVILKNPGYCLSVTVIVPTRDREAAIAECLASVFAQNYPAGYVEVIVIDDGSRDDTQKVIREFPCKLLINRESKGQSYCRNLGAAQAKGEVLAFLDDDCVAGSSWLQDLMPYLQWEKAGAVGGYVDGYADRSMLDRYEKECSLLNLGKYIQVGASDTSMFYVPTCNLLVRKSAFVATGGIRETLHVGEDVDFCWRIRDAGWRALYVPSGTVRHKHRNRFGSMLRRRADYGASEAVLSALHPKRRKSMQVRPLTTIAFLGVCAGAVFLTPLPFMVTLASFVAEAAIKALRLRARRVRVRLPNVISSAWRTYLSSFYNMAFHLVRYYFVLMLLLGFVLHSAWLLAWALMIFAACLSYASKRPRLPFVAFLFCYILDQISYQTGVFAGCVRAKSFRSYRLGCHLGRDPVC